MATKIKPIRSTRLTWLQKYRGYHVRVDKDGTWIEANILKDGKLVESIGSGSGDEKTVHRFIERGKRVIDAMKGD
jgi:hypothetical protein